MRLFKNAEKNCPRCEAGAHPRSTLALVFCGQVLVGLALCARRASKLHGRGHFRTDHDSPLLGLACVQTQKKPHHSPYGNLVALDLARNAGKPRTSALLDLELQHQVPRRIVSDNRRIARGKTRMETPASSVAPPNFCLNSRLEYSRWQRLDYPKPIFEVQAQFPHRGAPRQWQV